MEDKVKIKEEIENQIDSIEENTSFSEPYREGLIAAYQTIKAFIDSLPEEHNENLEEAIETYINDNFSEGCDGGMLSDDEPDLGGVTYRNLANISRHFAEWQKQKDFQDFMEKAVEWLQDSLDRRYVVRNFHTGEYYSIQDMIKDFKNYMKNEM